ncbi:MAG: hypothetical protein PW735_12885 [Acidobacteriaceae bacterium]|nr:hypothetical protein [Acidobacteriaceae bacterium]
MFRFTRVSALLVFSAALALPSLAQTVSNSSSSQAPEQQSRDADNPTARPRAAQIRAGGASVTLETSEPLFDLAAALNTCGYDADLDRSMPVRAEVRADINALLTTSEEARTTRDALCEYVRLHHLTDAALDAGQYVSLALYLSPPPQLTPNVGENEMPPQAAQVINVLPLLRNFSSAVNLHYIWLQHRAEFEAIVAQVHDPMQRMILDTNIALHLPVSSYDNRRFLVLLEPMLSPAVTNARIYGSDYIIVTSPDRNLKDVPVHIDQIRHIYLHYIVDPMVYSRGSAMERMQPLLAGVADAPLDFNYKSDVVALITECLIKALEARMYLIASPAPVAPKGAHGRAEDDAYMNARTAYERQTDLERLRLVDTDESQGWVLTGYFYQALGHMEGTSLTDSIAPIIYGMDLQRELHHAKEILFAKTSSVDPLTGRRAARGHRTLEGLDLAEMDLAQGKLNDAAQLAQAELAKPDGDKGRATYLLARLDLVHGDPEKAMNGFEQAIKLSKDPRTLSWSHIYLGRLYDTMDPPNRERAIGEYNAALANRDSQPDTKAAAETGIKTPFALPQRNNQPLKDATQATPAEDDNSFDPTGKAEKDSYRPSDAPKK